MSHLPRLRPLTRLLSQPRGYNNLPSLPTLATQTQIQKQTQSRPLRTAPSTSASATATATATATTPEHAPAYHHLPPTHNHGHSHGHNHPQSPDQQAEAEAKIAKALETHPLTQRLRASKTYTETRPHLSMHQTHRANHFVAGTLSGANKVTVPPYVFTRMKCGSSPTSQFSSQTTTQTTGASQTQGQAETISLFHLGSTLNGHPGYVHGGLLTVMFDETFARCVAGSFGSGVGMTANLSVDFRAPARPDSVYVLRAETVRVEGRKAWVQGSLRVLSPSQKKEGQGEMEEEEGTLVAEARALFVEPKFAQSMVPLYRN